MTTWNDQYGNDATATTRLPVDQAAERAGMTPAELRREIEGGRVVLDAHGRLSDDQLADLRRRQATLDRLRDVKATIRRRKATERRKRELIKKATASDRRRLLLARLRATGARRR